MRYDDDDFGRAVMASIDFQAATWDRWAKGLPTDEKKMKKSRKVVKEICQRNHID